jgi:hypothetical protein
MGKRRQREALGLPLGFCSKSGRVDAEERILGDYGLSVMDLLLIDEEAR